ncbi:hypothetical protein C8J56DRAFT_533137 [Mycena floridula]|nr:hypothetical protein C8J56DRAFT_533137 [Mycena floridula]
MKFFAALIALFIVSSTVSAYSEPSFYSRSDMKILEKDPSRYEYQYGIETRDTSYIEERDLEPSVPRSVSLSTRYASSLEPRQLQMIASQIVKEVLKTCIKAVLSLIKDLKDEKKNRELFVKHLLAGLVQKNNKFNYLIVHPKHTAKWEGTAGKDWHKEHVECDTIRLLKKTIGYDVYAGKKGVATLQGDGGYINWAFQGKFKRSGKQGHTLTFS